MPYCVEGEIKDDVISYTVIFIYKTSIQSQEEILHMCPHVISLDVTLDPVMEQDFVTIRSQFRRYEEVTVKQY